MAEEPIIFRVTDEGTTEAFEQLLVELGAVGEKAFNELGAAMGRFEEGSKAAAAAQELVNKYMAAGGKEIDAVGAAIQRLTATEVEAAAQSGEVIAALGRLGVAEQAVKQRVRERADATLAASVSVMEALKEEEAAYSIHAAMIKDAAFSAANAVNEAMDREVQAAEKASAALKTNTTGISSGFASAAAQIALFVTATSTIHDINTIASIKQQLQEVTGSATIAAEEFTKLSTVSRETGQPLETVAKNFTQVYASIKEGGGTVGQATDFVANLSDALQKTGTSTLSAQRLMHDLTEALAGGALQGRQLTSAFQQAPAVMELLSRALGVNIQSLTTHAQATEHAKDKLNELRASNDNSGESFAKAKSAYDSAANSITKTQEAMKKEQERIDELKVARGDHTEALKHANEAYDDSVAKLAKEETKLGDNRKALNASKQAVDEAHAAKIKHQEAIVATSEALDKETLLTTIGGKAFRELVDAQKGGVLTISQSITSLNAAYMQFLDNSGTASAFTRVFSGVVGLLANNLNTIIPIIAVVGAGWAAWKLELLVGKLVEYASSARVAAEVTALLNFAISPIGAAIVVLTAAAIGIISYFGEWGNVAKTLGDDIDTVKGYISATADQVASFLAPAFGNATQSTIDWRHIVEEFGGILNTVLLVAIKGVIIGIGGLIEVVGSIVAVFKKAYDYVIDTFVPDYQKGFSGINTQTQTLGSTIGEWVATVVNGYEKVAAWIQKLIDLYNALKDALKGAGQGGPVAGEGAGAGAGIGAARDGATVVPGSGGEDSRLIAVSPGEHVTIQTPEQFYNGKINTSEPGQHKFANGGSFLLAAQQSAVGFNATSAADYYKSLQTKADAAQTVTLPAPPANDNNNSNVNKDTGSNLPPSTRYFSNSGGGNVDTGAQAKSDAYYVALRQWEAKIQADRVALAAGGEVTASHGVPKPTDTSANPVITGAQALYWVNVNGQWRPRDNQELTFAGDLQSLYATYTNDLGNPPRARDGLDMTVPGGTGEDSRLLQLAVSPGERVVVKTPQQQMQDEVGQRRQSGRGQSGNVVMTVYTKDADSFGRSQAQLLDAARRKLQRGA